MSNIENLQSEFENLIAELEKLKSVNEFAATNTESAQNVIELMTEFVQRTENFEKELRSNHESKSESLSKLIAEFTESVKAFDVSRSNLETSLVSGLSEKFTEQKILIESLQKRIEESEQKVNLTIRGVKNDLSNTQSVIKAELLQSQEDAMNKVVSELEKNMSSLQNDISGLSKQNFMLLAIIAVISSLAAICSVLLLVFR